MPRYDIRCMVCGKEEEISKKMAEELPPCSTCGAQVIQMPPSSATFVLKGRGWARDGYQR